MKDRIEYIMQNKGLTPSQFAKIIGIKQASLSHILTGRNNPSLDVIMKINQTFPEINLEWLLYGKGEMECMDNKPRTENLTEKNMQQNKTNYISDLFATTESQNQTIGEEPSTILNNNVTKETENYKYIEIPPKKITEVRIFYNDGTYEILVPSR